MIYDILPVNTYCGNDSCTQFDFDFYIENENQIKVYLFNSEGIKIPLVYNADYSIEGIDNENGGYIIFPLEKSQYGVLSSKEKISLELDLPASQEVQYNNSSLLNLKTLEYSFDYLTRLVQILKRKFSLCVKVEECSKFTPDELLESIDNAYLVTNQNAQLALDASKSAQKSAQIAQSASSIVENAANNDLSNITESAKEVIKQNSSGLLVGQTIFSLEPLIEDNLHSLDGSLLPVGGIYNDFIQNYIIPLTNSNPERFISESEWQEQVVLNGVCDKYVYLEDEGVRLPKFGNKLYTNLPDDVPVVGNNLALGLSNGTVNIGLSQTYGNSIGFIGYASQYGADVAATQTGSGAYPNGVFGVTTDPVKSGIIADVSCVSALEGYWYIVLGTVTKNPVEVEIDNIVTNLNAKADADLSNVSSSKGILIESYTNGNSWYRVYSDGWCEQGGWIIPTTDWTGITLLKSYKNSRYSMIAAIAGVNDSTYEVKVGNMSKNTTTTAYIKATNATTGAWWTTFGSIN